MIRKSSVIDYTLALLTVMAISIAVRPSVAQHKEIDTPDGTMIVIDGSQHPEEIPEHWYWRHCFHKLSQTKRLGLNDYIQSIGLSPEDMASALKVADGQAARDIDCAKRIESRQAELKAQGAKPEALAQAFQDVTLECRYLDLEARDRLLEMLSVEGKERLCAWAVSIRRQMTVYWPAKDIEQFKRPY